MHFQNVMQNVASWVLWNSTGAAVLIALILAVRLVAGRAMSAQLRSRLWLLVVARLMLPLLPAVSISMPEKVASSVSNQKLNTSLSVTVLQDRNAPIRLSKPTIQTAGSSRVSWTQTLIAIWLAGTSILLARLLISTVHLARHTRQLQPVEDPEILELHRACCKSMDIASIPPMLMSDAQSAPALVGVLHPKILLPRSIESQLSPDEIRLVLLHELVHLRRRDVLLKYVTALLSAIHWFNPLVWIAGTCIAADREFACDEAVLRMTSPRQSRDYGHILLKLVELMNSSHLPTGAVGTIERAVLIQRRIDMIASYASGSRRHSRLVRSATAGLVIAAGVTAIRAQTLPTTAPAVPVAPASTQHDLDRRIYDVSALLVEIPAFVSSGTAPEMIVDPSLVKAGKVVDGDAPKDSDHTKAVQQLETWLKATVGNEVGHSLSISNGQLTVVAERTTQAHIAHLLEQLASRRSLQATIETRAITFTAFPVVSDELADKIRVSLAPGGTPVELNEYEMSQLMSALQQSSSNSITTAPRVTLFDGQLAQVFVATSKIAVKDANQFDRKKDDEISPGVTTPGGFTSLKIRPSVDADRVHIAIDFEFESSHAEDIKSNPGAAGIKAQQSTTAKVHVSRTLSTSTGHTLLMSLEPTALGEGPVRILMIRPTIIGKV